MAMRLIPRQFTLGSLMIAVAVVAIVLSHTIMVVDAILLLIGTVVLLFLSYALIVVPGFFVLGGIDRWFDARKVRELHIPVDDTPSATGIIFLEAETTGG
jgi:hypothetical protein